MKYKDVKVGMKVRVKHNIRKINSSYSEDVSMYEGKVYVIYKLDTSSYPVSLEGATYCFQPRLLDPAIDEKMQKLKEKMLE